MRSIEKIEHKKILDRDNTSSICIVTRLEIVIDAGIVIRLPRCTRQRLLSLSSATLSLPGGNLITFFT